MAVPKSSRTGTEPRPPVLPSEKEATGAIPASGFAAEADYERLFLRERSFRGQIAADVRLSAASFVRCDLAGTRMPRLELSDLRFDDCDLANADWEGVTVQRFAATGTRFLGLRASEARITDAVFVDCPLSLAAFGYTVFKSVRFERCNLTGADFQKANLKNAVFLDCDLTDARFTGAVLDGCDLRGSTLANLSIAVPDFRGLIVDPVQAAYLATFTGLTVR